MPDHYSAEDILDAFDKAATGHRFIVLDGGKEIPADARITVYRDSTRWCVVCEVLVFFNASPGHDGIVNLLYKIGNCVKVSHPKTGTDFDKIRVTADGPDAPAF